MADEKPRHKPSPKRTLEEVLKSLQDLIRHDLVARRAADSPPPPPSTPASPGVPDVLDEALDRLDELITQELIVPARSARVEPQPAPEEPLPEALEEPDGGAAEEAAPEDSPGEPEPAAGARRDTPAEPPAAEARSGAEALRFGIQDVLPFEEPPPSLASFLKEDAPGEEPAPQGERPQPPPAPEVAQPESAEAQPPAGIAPSETITQDAGAREESPAAGPGEAVAPASDDGIPVLHEIAEIAPAVELPNPERARDIAIRVVARLNIERRKAGEAPLDIRTIERLQQLLKDALADRDPSGGA